MYFRYYLSYHEQKPHPFLHSRPHHQIQILFLFFQFIIDAFQGRVKELSSHPYGCRVVQRILEHCSNPQKSVILEELRQCCAELVQDCYGNYVIQFVMQHGWEADRAVLIREVRTSIHHSVVPYCALRCRFPHFSFDCIGC